MPVTHAASPAQGEDAVRDRPDPGRRPVAEGGQVGNHARVPEQQRHREISSDREDVPQQRAAELRPDLHLVGDGEHPVEDPHPTDVDAGEHPRADDREDRHRLGKPVDAGPPLLTEQMKDRRDQRAGVADADPEDEVDDRESPHHRVHVAPHADAGGEEVQDQAAENAEKRQRDHKGDVPCKRRAAGLVDRADLLRHRAELVMVQHQRRPPRGIIERVVDRQRRHPMIIRVPAPGTVTVPGPGCEAWPGTGFAAWC